MTFLKHSIGKTYYEIKGKQRDENHFPLICLHGGPGGTSKRLEPLLKLAKDRKVVLYDQVGGGRSSATETKHWCIESFVRELDYLIRHLKIEEFHIYSASWGTTLALEYYLRKNKGQVKSMTFQSPMFSARDWMKDAKTYIQSLPEKTQKVINLCHEIGATDSKVYKEALKEYYLRHVLRDKKKLEKFFKAISKNPHGEKVYEYMWGPSEFEATGTLKSYERVKSLKDIEVPVQFIVGEYDEASPNTAKKYSKLIKHSSVEIIPGAAHLVLAEAPVKVCSLVSQFLKKFEKETE